MRFSLFRSGDPIIIPRNTIPKTVIKQSELRYLDKVYTSYCLVDTDSLTSCTNFIFFFVHKFVTKMLWYFIVFLHNKVTFICVRSMYIYLSIFSKLYYIVKSDKYL